MSKFVKSYNVHVRGGGDTPEEADKRALARLDEANHELQSGALPKDPGVSVKTVDPGGNGGPCAPIFIDVSVDVSASGLPEAQRRDD